MKRIPMTITYSDGRQEIEYIGCEEPGVFGSLFRLRREERLRKAQAQRDSRLLQLERDIKALEDWHHAWRLEHDEGFRELHPREWCEPHRMLTSACPYSHYRRHPRVRPAQREAPELPLEVRRAATRTIAAWGKSDAV
ncbi:hypothetical protein [Streptomyces fulvorobeus]|uniref:Uncharacterized protein n=1 Tax=Streptomyces fulvorobeus TaxID=284028 RepID=A0A7J0CFU7_9ACTN|nr:hypothetical protein [Streptomyces fulvorobeus]NYE44268.1 hypothetical protein [Streptomyces fulvorobeus]GFN00784.1 hypothetical protein Sfulv_55940 [Streptomyces fulvorobeus]